MCWWTWQRRVPLLAQKLTSSPDFSVTISVVSKTRFFYTKVKEIQKTIEIEKKGGNIRVEMPFWGLLKDVELGCGNGFPDFKELDKLESHSLLFQGDDEPFHGVAAKGSARIKNLDKLGDEYVDAFQKAKDVNVDVLKVRSQLKQYNLKFDFSKAVLKRKKISRGVSGVRDTSVYVGKKFGLEYKLSETDVIDAGPGKSQGYKEIVYKTENLKPSVSFDNDFIKMRRLEPILDFLAENWSGIGYLMELLKTLGNNYIEAVLPIKISIPVVPSMSLMATVTKYWCEEEEAEAARARAKEEAASGEKEIATSD